MVRVRSPKTASNCAPDFGCAEVDFERLTDGQPSVVEYACAPASPDEAAQWQLYVEALVAGAMAELVSQGVAARVVVRAITFHPLDSSEAVFARLGASAVREALNHHR